MTRKKTALDWGCHASAIDTKKKSGVRFTDPSALGGDSAVAAEGCLLRLTRLEGCPIIAGHGSTLGVNKDGYFASSLMEWGTTAERCLRFGGTNATGTVNQLISTVMHGEPQLVKTLSNAGVLTLGDVIETPITQNGGEERR